MSAPASCPGCGAKLQPDMEACPNCPLSFTGQDEAENNPFKVQSRLRDMALPLAFFGLLGFAVWKLGTGLLGVAQDPTQHETGSFSTAGGPATKEQVAKTMDDSFKQLDAITSGSSHPENRRGSVLIAEPDATSGEDAGEGAGTISVVKEAGQASRPPREWRLRGRVYDLVTLKPVSGALLTLVDTQTNVRAQTMTGADGRYKTVLPPLSRRGYVVTIRKSGYAQSYAGPESAGVQDLDAGSRKELARQLGRSVEAPTALEPGSDDPLLTDFFLAPLP